MAKAARKRRVINSNSNYGNLKIRSGQTAPISSPQVMQQSYDAGRYIKNDLKWSAICTVIVVVLLFISYLLFRQS